MAQQPVVHFDVARHNFWEWVDFVWRCIAAEVEYQDYPWAEGQLRAVCVPGPFFVPSRPVTLVSLHD